MYTVPNDVPLDMSLDVEIEILVRKNQPKIISFAYKGKG